MGKVDTWLGLTEDPSITRANGKVPMWNGVPSRTKFIWVAVWVVIAIVTFWLANWNMLDADGFGGFIPLFLALFIFIAGIAVTERSVLKSNNNTGGKNGENAIH